ncbi:DUF4113 domain-containing protein [Enterobacter sp. 22466]|uniref:DUF4113 domain-containing protein n=1 Tax=Enterobacter sp. 22466 TaxID=3453924 RepID=UPI003F871EE3
MAKPDWGELQQRFLSEHAATGVSPKEWCEAQGLNYATARRYIKKPSAQTAQKPAQKKMRTAQKEKSADELVDIQLSAKVKRFIAEYLKDNNATAAAARAGYSDPNYGRQLITNPNVAQAIAQQQKASIVRALGSADEVLEQMWQLATFDANQLSQYRRGACRYCWGTPTQDSRDIINAAVKCLDKIWKDGHRYQKAGIMLGDFFSQGVAQLNLFDENAPRAGSERLMEVLDHLNAKDGKGTLYFAGQGVQQQWQMKREMLSPRYTTRYSDLLRIR